MRSKLSKGLLWILGVFGLAALIFHTGWNELIEAVGSIDYRLLLGWVAITIAIRIIMIEALTRPLTILGKKLRHMDAFWLGWLRSFFNQVVPMSGTAYFMRFIKMRTTISWGQIVALGSPQILFSTLAIGSIGLISTSLNLMRIETPIWPIASGFALLILGSLFAIYGSGVARRILRGSWGNRFALMFDALDKFHSNPGLILWLITIHTGALLLRALRLWLLFIAIGYPIEWSTLLLLSCIGEITLILQLTPGGIGIKEGALVGAAYILGLNAGSVTAVAVLDRLLIMLIVAISAPAAVYYLQQPQRRSADDA